MKTYSCQDNGVYNFGNLLYYELVFSPHLFSVNKKVETRFKSNIYSHH